MEIHFHSSVPPVGTVAPPPKTSVRQAQSDEQLVTLENVQALRSALANTPDSRPDAVARATQLVGRVEYPPPETIQKISHLLAMHLQSESQS